MDDLFKISITVLVTLGISMGSAYVYIRVTIASLNERHNSLALQVLDTKNDLAKHKDKIYEKINEVLREIKDMRKEHHDFIIEITKRM